MRTPALSFCLLLTSLSCAPAREASVEGASETIRKFELKDSRLTESSGIAPSRTRKGVYYTHNDSGDTARFFAFTLQALKLEEYDVENARARDWEDMATATVAGQPYVYFGDIGDNSSRRKSIHVYRVPEPGAGGGKVRADLDLELTYPDGAHNAETLLVQPGTGDLTIVTKSQDKTCGVYSLANPSASGRYALRKLGEIAIPSGFGPARLVTGGAVSPDGKFIVLRTYLEGYEYPAGAEWWKATPLRIALDHDPQGEGITYSVDGKSFLTTSEGSPCPVSVMPRSRVDGR